VQPTPLCGPKIVAILKAGFMLTAFAIYICGAADAQSVGRLGNVVGIPFLVA
jgi:hypothetical protein